MQPYVEFAERHRLEWQLDTLVDCYNRNVSLNQEKRRELAEATSDTRQRLWKVVRNVPPYMHNVTTRS